MGRYIVGYKFGNHVLLLRLRVAVKLNFRPCTDDIPPKMKILHTVIPSIMVTFQALKEGRTPDYSDYKEFEITCENIGFQMLQNMGWKEGEGLGSEGQGIKKPVNKYVYYIRE